MPRLELCAVLEATKAASVINYELRREPDAVYLYSDSKIVLGYLANKTRHFSKYVKRRICNISSIFPSQHWFYVPTGENPAI